MASEKTNVTARLTSSSFDCTAMRVREVKGREAISEPFVFDVELILPGDASFRAKTTLGKDVRLVFAIDDAEVRHVGGIVAEAVDVDATDQYSRHRLRIVPQIHRMTLSASCEVFLGKSVLDIALDKLNRAGVLSDAVSVKVAVPPKPSEFRLQYAESDFTFVSRHLEHAGIAYFFDQTGATDVLVLSDDNAAFPHAVGPSSVPFAPDDAANGSVTLLQERSAMVSTLHVVNDYRPAHPKLDLCGTATLDVPFGGEIIDFGTGHGSAHEGDSLAHIRAQARLALAEGFEGESTLPQVEAAHTIAVDGHPFVGSERLLVVWVEHLLTQTTRAHAEADLVLGYTNRFRALDATRQYRPPPRTPQPRISGFAVAVTDVPKGATVLDTALLDPHGRYTVHFLFDRADDKGRPVSSARLRMMQPHTGAGYGMHFPLKPGIEVAVGFYEGDPDRPFIAGAVPNALTPTPAMDRNAKIHHLQTGTGVSLKMRDG